MIICVCNACRRRIDDGDVRASRNVLLGGDRHDWCGDCSAFIRDELPGVVAQAREAQRTAEQQPRRLTGAVRTRALNLWQGGAAKTPPLSLDSITT